VIRDIRFLRSSPGLKDMPDFEYPEFAFIGRSNVGKSSLINMLCGRKGLAKTSGTPGKTRLINHFSVTSHGPPPGSKPHEWLLVDLPGYGFAKLSKEQREKFEGLIRGYLMKRENLACTFLLIDSRLPAQKIDLSFMNWLGDNGISFVILFTKTDKLSKNQLQSNLKSYRGSLAEHWEEIPLVIPTSAISNLGKEEILSLIQQMLSEIL